MPNGQPACLILPVVALELGPSHVGLHPHLPGWSFAKAFRSVGFSPNGFLCLWYRSVSHSCVQTLAMTWRCALVLAPSIAVSLAGGWGRCLPCSTKLPVTLAGRVSIFAGEGNTSRNWS